MEQFDLKWIYDQLKDRYVLTLTNAFALDAGFTIDCPVLTGKNHGNIFYLYYDGDIAVFDVLNETKTAGTHWHPYDESIALEDVVSFMGGIRDYELTSF